MGKELMKEFSQRLKERCDNADLLRMAYVDQQGHPRVAPVWFAKVDGSYYAGTENNSLKWRCLLVDPRAGWTIDGGQRPRYWGAVFTGKIEVVSDDALRACVYQALGEKYYGASDNPEFVQIYGPVDSPDIVYFKLAPEIQNGWEY